MLTAVKATYENGVILLDEPLPTNKAKLIVTVIEDLDVQPNFRQAGTMKGSFKMSSDFDEPLEDLKEYM